MDPTRLDDQQQGPGSEPLAIDGRFDAGHDNLMEIISQMEARLAALRDSESQRDRLQEEIRHQFDDLDERERDLRRREASLAGTDDGLHADRASLDAERARIHDSLQEVSKERESLRTREIEVGVLSETLRRDRELLEGRRSQLEALERELVGREQVLVTQTELIDQEAGALEGRRKELEAREAALRELESETRAMAAAQDERAQALSTKERELSASQERYQAMQSEVISLNRRLADANAMAAEQARQVEQVRAEGARALEEARRSCEKLEAESARVRAELAKVRRQPASASSEDGAVAASPVRRVKGPSPRSRSATLAVIWLMTVGVAALAAYIGVTLHHPAAAAWLVGLAFAGCFIGSMGASSKPLDPSSLPVILFGGTFGLWFPRLFELVANALETWDLPLSGLPSELLPQLPLAISLLASGIVVTFGLAFLGASGSLMVQSLFATLAACGLSLLPDPSYSALAAGALLWHAIMAAGLSRWVLGPPDQGVPEDVSPTLRRRLG